MSLSTKNGNDEIYTPDKLTFEIIKHFNPTGNLLEPCRGTGSFYYNMITHAGKCNWCEITEGIDFFKNTFKDKQFDWIVTNPPWGYYRKFLNESMRVANNIVFLCLINHLFMKARLRDVEENKFGIKEILKVKEPTNKEWPKTGFQLGVIHLQHNYIGDIKFGELNWA